MQDAAARPTSSRSLTKDDDLACSVRRLSTPRPSSLQTWPTQTRRPLFQAGCMIAQGLAPLLKPSISIRLRPNVPVLRPSLALCVFSEGGPATCWNQFTLPWDESRHIAAALAASCGCSGAMASFLPKIEPCQDINVPSSPSKSLSLGPSVAHKLKGSSLQVRLKALQPLLIPL
eukprot:TRINITY_DN74687_c0_g1_i1.p1 TRINITY_DN74687_c0_g1~~TRINITY_DN74687_c0_g1_i1.p1  ORF type:complete len:174 (+),score=16.84 TRINITY_DN74687_c0_g1_i1:99-620(+)